MTSVPGKKYEDAAEITYRQPFMTDEWPITEAREATIHLVVSDGIWRWFFGSDPTWNAQLPDSC